MGTFTLAHFQRNENGPCLLLSRVVGLCIGKLSVRVQGVGVGVGKGRGWGGVGGGGGGWFTSSRLFSPLKGNYSRTGRIEKETGMLKRGNKHAT